MSDIVTAGILVIGDEILSGRTKDKNIGFIAEYLTNIGIDLKEVRVVSDDEADIIAALDALRHRYTYVFTTGGIGPTHDDITADAVAKAFGVGIDHHPEVVARFRERWSEQDLNEARLRMAAGGEQNVLADRGLFRALRVELLETGCVDATRAKARELAHAARARLLELPDGPARHALEAVVAASVARAA